MIRRIPFLLLLFCIPALPALSQGRSTDFRQIQLYAFGGATGTYTGLSGGRNLGVTAGVDIGLGQYFGVLPLLEVRGTYPVHSGTIVGEKNFLGGLRVEKIYGRYHPYVDVLFGRGQLVYQGGGYPDPTLSTLWLRTNSNVFSPGVGVDIDVTRSFAFRADAQYQHYQTPVTVSGSLYSTAITAGVVYRFGYRGSRPYTE
ncbi:MAG: hypothetical protein ABI142_08670 [Bryocella sp.]